jgi:hypothetical protein
MILSHVLVEMAWSQAGGQRLFALLAGFEAGVKEIHMFRVP